MDENLDFFSDFLALLALEKAAGVKLVAVPQLTERQKEEICNDALQKLYEAIYSPMDPPEDDDTDEEEQDGTVRD